MSQRPQTRLVILCLGLVLLVSETASAQQLIGNRPVAYSDSAGAVHSSQLRSGGDSSRANTRQCFAVMGEVARPGTYEFPQQFLPLVDLVETAGGLTDRASGNIRLVRNGRDGMQMYFTPTSPVRLLPGDLVIVDQHRQAAVTPPQVAAQNVADVQSRDNQSTTIQLAFLQLVDTPVVLKMRVDEATLRQIAANLQQSSEAATQIRVIRPRKSTVADSLTSIDDVLPACSALVFNRALLNTELIPPLPAPIRPVGPASQPQAGTASHQSAAAGAAPQTTLLPPPPVVAVPQRIPSIFANSNFSNRETASSSSDVAVERNDKTVTGTPTPAANFVTNRPHVDSRTTAGSPTRPFAETGSHTASNRAHIQATVAGVSNQERNSPPVSARIDRLADAANAAFSRTAPRPPQEAQAMLGADSSALVVAEPDVNQGRSQIITQVVSCAIVLALAIAFGLLWSIARQGVTAKVAVQPPVVEPAINRLSALVNNELPLVVEPLGPASVAEFSGRPATRKPYRVDSSHPIPEPVSHRTAADKHNLPTAEDIPPATVNPFVTNQTVVNQSAVSQTVAIHSGANHVLRNHIVASGSVAPRTVAQNGTGEAATNAVPAAAEVDPMAAAESDVNAVSNSVAATKKPTYVAHRVHTHHSSESGRSPAQRVNGDLLDRVLADVQRGGRQ